MSWHRATWVLVASLALPSCLFRGPEEPAGYPQPRPTRPTPEPQPPDSRVPIEPSGPGDDAEARAAAQPRDGGTEGPLTVPPAPPTSPMPRLDGGTLRR